MIHAKQLRAVVIALCFSGMVYADFIDGVVWSVPTATTMDAPRKGQTPGPDAVELATFTANGIDFSGDSPGAYTLGGFLNSGGTAANIVYMNGASADTGLDNTEWEFTGSAFFTMGTNFNVVHDDGVNLYVGNSPALLAGVPSLPILNSFTYNGPTGTNTFDFIYVECCGGSADFQTDLVPSAATTELPEPSSAGLLLAGSGVCMSIFVLMNTGRRRRHIASWPCAISFRQTLSTMPPNRKNSFKSDGFRK